MRVVSSCSALALIVGSLVPSARSQVAWTEAPLPQERYLPASFYDPVLRRVILFGGEVFTVVRRRFADTWAWDGTAWSKLAPPQSPPAAWEHAVAYDTRRQRGVLYDGWSVATWEWDGASWTQGSVLGPPFRQGSRIAYDAARGKVMLFGGQELFGAVLADTWEWDGSFWTPRMPATSPPARSGHALAYDTRRQRVVLFGGGGRADTWEWSGSDWTQRLPRTSPPGRSGHAMTWDEARGRVVLFGGGAGLADTWVPNRELLRGARGFSRRPA
jgi:hypothetical protein